MTPEQLPAWALSLLDAAPLAHLGLLDEQGAPRVQPVTFAFVDGLVWSAVDHKPKRVAPERLARVRRLRRDPRAAVTVDRYAEDWSRLAWVTLLGPVTVYDTPSAAGAPGAAALERLQAKYAPYRDRQPDGPLLALAPERTIVWDASARADSGPVAST